MAGMSIDGLASGMDTTTLISQLMQLERQPQTLLKTKLTDTKADASAYRTVNSTFSTLQSAAEALTKATTWAPAKASSSAGSVSVSAAPGAALGQVGFRVDTLAASHALISQTTWTPPASDTTLAVIEKDGTTTRKSIAIAAGATLDQAVTAINAANAGVTATAVNTGSGFRLQLTATASGADGAFSVTGGPTTLAKTSQGTNAKLTIGAGGSYPYEVTSSTNTFTDLMPGTTFTVNEAGANATVTVASDPAAVTTAVQSLVTAANNVLSTISEYSNNAPGSTAVLRGDSSLRGLAGQVIEAVTYAVGSLGSAAGAGIQLSKNGTRIEFSADTFTAKLKADPTLAQDLVNGSGSVPGVAQRLLKVAKDASDSTTGTLATLAKGKDTEATDLQKRIDAWDLRLELRQQTLTRQFTAMESALGVLQNQSSWLSSQLGSLPSWSK